MKKYITIITVIAILLGAFTVQASAHDWYPYNCCSAHDCHPISCESIYEQGKTLVHKGFQFYDNMIKPSLDGQCHVCISNEDHSMGDFTPVPHCIFIQQGS